MIPYSSYNSYILQSGVVHQIVGFTSLQSFWLLVDLKIFWTGGEKKKEKERKKKNSTNKNA